MLLPADRGLRRDGAGLSDLDRYKRQAALAAVDRMTSGTVVGLGSGSTAAHAVTEIAARLDDGRLSDVRGIPTSAATEALGRAGWASRWSTRAPTMWWLWPSTAPMRSHPICH